MDESLWSASWKSSARSILLIVLVWLVMSRHSDRQDRRAPSRRLTTSMRKKKRGDARGPTKLKNNRLPPVVADWFQAKGWQPRRHQLEMLDLARARSERAAGRGDRRRQDAGRIPAEHLRARGRSRRKGCTRSTSRR